MHEALQPVQAAREAVLEAQRALDERITQTRAKIHELTIRGVLPFDEAYPAWLASFDDYVAKGQRELQLSFEDFATVRDQDPASGRSRMAPYAGDPFRIREFASGGLNDNGAQFAALHAEQIREHARAWFEQHCSGETLPAAAERRAEAKRLAEELEALQAERDDLQDELSRLFRVEPSERTKRAQREQTQAHHLEMLNAPARDRSPLAGNDEGGILRQAR